MALGQIVLEDNLLKAYLDFQEGISVDPKLAKDLFSYYKPHLSNKSQYDRIGRQMGYDLQAQLQASGIKENLSLTDLAKESSLKLILSERNTNYPFVAINGSDSIKLRFGGTYRSNSPQKCIKHLEDLCSDCSNVTIFDNFLATQSNVALLENVCSLCKNNPSCSIQFVLPQNEYNRQKSIFDAWLNANKNKFQNLDISQRGAKNHENYHDRYMIIKRNSDRIEILLSSGFDNLFRGNKDFTYVVFD